MLPQAYWLLTVWTHNTWMMGLLWLYLPFLCKHQGIGVVGLDTYTRGIKDFHKCWSGSLAKRRLCLGPASVINCTALSALSFWVSLFPRMCGYNIMINATIITWPQDEKNWLVWKDPDAGKDWKQEEKGTTEDEKVGWHHQLNGHEFE